MKVDHHRVVKEVRRQFDEWCNSPSPMPRFLDEWQADDGLRCANPRRVTLEIWLESNCPTALPWLDEIWNCVSPS